MKKRKVAVGVNDATVMEGARGREEAEDVHFAVAQNQDSCARCYEVLARCTSLIDVTLPFNWTATSNRHEFAHTPFAVSFLCKRQSDFFFLPRVSEDHQESISYFNGPPVLPLDEKREKKTVE